MTIIKCKILSLYIKYINMCIYMQSNLTCVLRGNLEYSHVAQYEIWK